MIDISARSLNQIVYCLVIHIGRTNSCKLFSVLAGIICCYQAGSVKGIQSNDLNVFDLNRITRFYCNAAICRNTPFLPQFYRFLRSDKWYGNLFSLFVCCCHAALNYMGCILSAHMILMVMGRQHCVYLLNGKGIDHKGDCS